MGFSLHCCLLYYSTIGAQVLCNIKHSSNIFIGRLLKID